MESTRTDTWVCSAVSRPNDSDGVLMTCYTRITGASIKSGGRGPSDSEQAKEEGKKGKKKDLIINGRLTDVLRYKALVRSPWRAPHGGPSMETCAGACTTVSLEAASASLMATSRVSCQTAQMEHQA